MLSQQEVADRAGTSLFTIQRIERGEGNVRPKTGRGVAAALGIPIEELLPKNQAPLPFSSPVDGAEADEERAHYLRHFRVFIDTFARRWEEKPPETFRETAPFNVALIEVLGQGLLEPPWQAGPKELDELDRLSDGLGRLHDVAAEAKRKERAESTKREAS
jgi:transcriptional regulator with XRE-family HTH domain